MNTQVFRGKTLDEAQRAAIRALGDDAVIVATRRVTRRGWLGVLGGAEIEVTATEASQKRAHAAERWTPFARGVYAADGPPKVDPLAGLRAELRGEIRSLRTSLARPLAPPPSSAALENEIAALRAAVEGLVASSPTPHRGEAAKILGRTGIEGAPLRAVLRAIAAREGPANSAIEAVREALASQLRVVPWPVQGKRRALVGFVGPTGVGKTTTLAKLAARAILDEEATATLVTCDTVRVGAVEQLSRYARLLEAHVEVASTADGLRRAIESASTDYVFVDFAGRVPTGTEDPLLALGDARIGGASEGAYERHVLLCLPAAIRASDALDFAKAFRPCKPTALAITKLDESSAAAGIVHGALGSGLPLSVLCFGPRVPEDIAPATPNAIGDYLLVATRGAR